MSNIYFHKGTDNFDNVAGMDVYEVRREQLRLLLETMTQTRLGQKSGVASSYISRAAKDPGEPGYKNIGEVTARKLEAGAKKPVGWLDRRVDVRHPQEMEEARELNESLSGLSDEAVGLAQWFDRLPHDPLIRAPAANRVMRVINLALELAESGQSIASVKLSFSGPDAAPTPAPTQVSPTKRQSA